MILPNKLYSDSLARTIGKFLLVVAVTGICYFSYEVLWTNHVAHRAATNKSQAIKNDWQHQTTTSAPAIGEGFALLYIPRLKSDVWELPILHGTEPEQLDVGAGHYVNTRLPGESGNFAIAAHRSTHGQPFAHIEQLRAGDRVIVQTRDTWYTYALDVDAQVSPDDAWVLEDNPGGIANKVGSDKIITLTTCTPRYGSSGRWIWWGHLVESAPIKDIPADVQ